MPHQPLVSVILIFLNGEKFIVDAVESVLSQTYNDWELTLVDDGSHDGSSEIALHYANKLPNKIRYLEHDGHQNKGMSASRNYGVQKSQGKYIALLDSDDAWLPHKLEKQVEALNAHPEVAMIYNPSYQWHSWTGKREDLKRDFVRKLGVPCDTIHKPPTLQTMFLKDGETIPCPSSFLIRRSTFEAIGGFEESFKGLYEDQAFLAKICLRAPIYVMGDYLDKYRQHDDSCCSIANRIGSEMAARKVFLSWLSQYINKQQIDFSTLSVALKRALLPYEHALLYSALSKGRNFLRYLAQKSILRINRGMKCNP